MPEITDEMRLVEIIKMMGQYCQLLIGSIAHLFDDGINFQCAMEELWGNANFIFKQLLQSAFANVGINKRRRTVPGIRVRVSHF